MAYFDPGTNATFNAVTSAYYIVRRATTAVNFQLPALRNDRPRNWRWFHRFRLVVESFVLAPAPLVGQVVRRVQERRSLLERNRNKRRAFVHSLRSAA